MKYLARVSETEKVIERIEALESVAAFIKPDSLLDPVIPTMLLEYKERYDYLKSMKEFMVHFEGGGWNTIHGYDEEDAFAKAVYEFCNGDNSKHAPLVVKSVSLASAEGIEAAMRLFY